MLIKSILWPLVLCAGFALLSAIFVAELLAKSLIDNGSNHNRITR